LSSIDIFSVCFIIYICWYYIYFSLRRHIFRKHIRYQLISAVVNAIYMIVEIWKVLCSFFFCACTKTFIVFNIRNSHIFIWCKLFKFFLTIKIHYSTNTIIYSSIIYSTNTTIYSSIIIVYSSIILIYSSIIIIYSTSN